jgi:hypothetical protein
MKQEDNSIRVIPALGEVPKFFGFSRDLIAPWAIIFLTFYFFLSVMLSLGDVWWITFSIWFCAAWAVLSGKKSYQFTNKFIPLPGHAYFNPNRLFIPATDQGSFSRQMRQKNKPLIVKTKTGKKEKIFPFDIESDLHSILRIKLEEDDFSVFLLCDQEDNWSATIPFALEGIHPELSVEKATASVEALTESLKDIPWGESMTLMLGCHSSYRKRLQQLKLLSNKTKLPLIKIILLSEQDKLQDITNKGFRQEWSQYAFCTWTQNKQDLRRQSDLLGRTVSFINKTIDSYSKKLTGTENLHQRNIYCRLATEIYQNSFLPWKLNLSTKAELKFRPLNPQEIWSDLLWYRFNQELDSFGNLLPVPPIPQLITVFQTGNQINYKVQVSNPTHPKDIISTLIQGQQGEPMCPQHNQRRDVIALKNKYLAAMTLEGAPEKWKDPKKQLTYLWQGMSSTHIKDTEIWIELSNGDKQQAQTNLLRIAKQSNISKSHAAQKPQGRDVAAEQNYDDAITAQERLNNGDLPLFAALTVLVERSRPELLEPACQRLSNSFGTAELIRERTICWKIWNETFPFNVRRQLKTALSLSERRPTLDTTSVIGLSPLVKPKKLHFDGLELIYREGGFPVYLNLFENNERAVITGKSGSGKSVLAFGFIKHALASGIPVVGLDLSDAGESTFELITSLLGDQGSYINILEHHTNILQPPDLRKFNNRERAKRKQIWFDFTRLVITSLAMGQIEDQQLLQAVDSCVIRLINIFFSEPTIVERYKTALKYGWQSKQWQNIPTLHDLLFFCSIEKLGLFEAGAIEERAINQINNQIRAKLEDPIIGRAIGSPSNVPPEPLMKFFALSGMSNENNQYIMSLVAHLACLNTSLEHPRSLSVFDECPSLFTKRGFAELVGQRFATGRKEGQSVIVIGQNIDAIVNSSAGSQILDNTDIKLTGHIADNAALYLSQKFGIPPHIIYRNTSASYEANRQYGYSHWLVSRSDLFWDCLYFPSVYELAALANGGDNKVIRNLQLAKFPDNLMGRLQATSHFACLFNQANVSNLPISMIAEIEYEQQSYESAA